MHKSIRWWGKHCFSAVPGLNAATQTFRTARQRSFLRSFVDLLKVKDQIERSGQMHELTGSWGTVLRLIQKPAGPLLGLRRHRARTARRGPAPRTLLLGLALGAATPAALAQTIPVPLVDGLFYAKGDDALYTPYQTAVSGSVLYSYLDIENTTLYVALVVDQTNVNDLVCSADQPYTASAGWNPPRSCKRLSDSEFASWTLECAPGSPNSWSWQQALGCAETAGPSPSGWKSDSTCGPSSPEADWPPGVEENSKTSWITNINTYQAAIPQPGAWNLYADGAGVDGWKSPFVSSNENDVNLVPGYPTVTTYGDDFSQSDYDWEWPMVYEWSVNLGADGTQCADETIFFISGQSHHSPAKTDEFEDDVFPPPENPIMTDWGDLPEGVDPFGVNRSYGTTAANDGGRHNITVEGPYLGDQVQTERDGVPTTDATGDGVEEDGVTFDVTSEWTAGSIQQIEVVVGNAPTGTVLAGWFDWNNDGDFDDPGEFFTWDVSTDTNTNTLDVTVGSEFEFQSQDLYSRFRIVSDPTRAPGGDGWQQGDYVGLATHGEIEDYHNPPGSLPVTLNAFSSRFSGGGLEVRWQTASETNNVGFELHGQDYQGQWRTLGDFVVSQGMNSALPQTYEQSVAAGSEIKSLALVDYDTRGRPERFGPFASGESYGEVQPVERIDWTGPRVDRERRLASRGFVNMSRRGAGDRGASAHRRGDRRGGASGKRSAGRAAAASANRVVADFSKRERFRKLVQPATSNGRGTGQGPQSEPVTVSVSSSSSQEVGSTDSSTLTGGQDDGDAGTITLQTGPVTHVAVTDPGIQRVSYEALRDAGLDLAGVDHQDIAVTSRGDPVARWISGGDERFGPGQWIEFIGRPPQGDEALYIESNLYQVSVDASRARSAGRLGQGRARQVSASRQGESMVDRPQLYRPQSPTGDPWVEQEVVVRGSDTVNLELPVAGPVAAGEAILEVGLGTITNLPDRTDAGGEVLPEHNVEIELVGPDAEPVTVTTASTSGQRDWTIEAALPSGSLEPGTYELRLHFSTEYLFSLLVVDRYGLRYPTSYAGPRLDFAPDPEAGGYRVEDLNSTSVSAYAEGADGSLTRIDPRMDWTGDGYAAELRQVDAERLWVDEAPRTPDVFTTQAPGDLLAEPGNLVVIADSSFIDTQALEDYVQDKSAYNPVVVDVEDIYNSVGYGMALPGAITDYLKARNEVHSFTHVQLVGTDCYDRLNYISECLSLIPLPTARVGITYYSPSQNRLVDLDGDGVGDKPVGQFSVRNNEELATIVAKGSSWRNWQTNVAGRQSALLIAEETDGKNDFLGQIERLDERLDWPANEVLDLADHPDIQTARGAFKESLESGQALTVFSGHSSPVLWAFRSLLTANSAKDLTNTGYPTTMVPLACETTYDVSPNANVLGHQLLYAGDQGAVAISGAVSLSSLADNERMASHIIDGMKAGLTLGEAVQQGREKLGPGFHSLHDNWLTQGDVTTSLSVQ